MTHVIHAIGALHGINFIYNLQNGERASEFYYSVWAPVVLFNCCCFSTNALSLSANIESNANINEMNEIQWQIQKKKVLQIRNKMKLGTVTEIKTEKKNLLYYHNCRAIECST